jgi:alpha-N-arabinofuranosidase
MTYSNTIYVETHRGHRRYDPLIFGQFLEHFHRQVYGGVFEPGSPLANEQGFRLDVIEALRELKVPVVRWPGGCFVSAYHWLHGVGPERRPSYDKAWRVEEPNTFGTDEFIAWCRLIGAEPYICTNAGTGTPEEMSDWVEYCNLSNLGRWARLRQANGYDEPHRVQYWSIGNENYGSWEMGAKTIEEWGPFVAESAKMMKHVDPGIKLLAAALPDVDWTLKLLRHAGQYLDYVSIHGYWDPLWQEDRPSDYATCMSRALEPEAAIRTTEQIIAIAGFEGRIGIAFDEWNLRGWHHPRGNNPEAIAARDRNDLNATYTMADAVFSAGFLNACLRHADSVRMANMAPVVNTRGPLFVHPTGLVKRPTFHVLSMYANLLQAYVVDTWVTGDTFTPLEKSVPVLDVVASCDEAMKKWSLALVNRHPDTPVSCQVIVGGQVLQGPHQVTVLSGDSPDAYNDTDFPDRVIPHEAEQIVEQGQVELSPHSVTVIQTFQN